MELFTQIFVLTAMFILGGLIGFSIGFSTERNRQEKKIENIYRNQKRKDK